MGSFSFVLLLCRYEGGRGEGLYFSDMGNGFTTDLQRIHNGGETEV